MKVNANITNRGDRIVVHTTVAPTEPGMGPEVATRVFPDIGEAMRWVERFLAEGTAAEWKWA